MRVGLPLGRPLRISARDVARWRPFRLTPLRPAGAVGRERGFTAAGPSILWLLAQHRPKRHSHS